MIKIPDQLDPPSNVFAMATPHHLLLKLYWEIKQLRASLVSRGRSVADTHAPAYHAFNCAVTCWHLTDWVWEAADDYQRQLMSSVFETRLKAVEDFQIAMRSKHRSLYICWQIANGSKHFRLRKTDPKIKTDEVWEYRPAMAGRMRAGQRLGSYVYRLSLTDGDQRRGALEIFEDALKVWERELAAWFFIEGRYIGPDDDSP
ncbi:hypothetical protein [Bradyrhizobium diazoefficiens]|uniref:Uncharacterized protein n=1 Tax=Bradyrhizobium diazoefficiens TaxID=1355477 RepID=A0A810BBM0_9BRAD|nr:hypothetical protein XF8B_40430 [Bradyrhizobium diazoefficiens]